MISKHVPLIELMNRASARALASYTEKFKDLRKDASELRFGPMDWLEADVWASVSGKLVILNQSNGEVVCAPPDLASMMPEIETILRSAPNNSDLVGYNIAYEVPNNIRARSTLWRPDIASTASDQPGCKPETRFVNNAGEHWENFHQTLSFFWSRQTYRVNLEVFDWLSSVFKNKPEAETAFPDDFEDHMLGTLGEYASKWRRYEGSVLAVDSDFAERAWKRRFDKNRGRTVATGGRPNKSAKAIEIYLKLFPLTHHHPNASPTGNVSWKAALRVVNEQLEYDIAESTFKREVRKQPRYIAAKK